MLQGEIKSHKCVITQNLKLCLKKYAHFIKFCNKGLTHINYE